MQKQKRNSIDNGKNMYSLPFLKNFLKSLRRYHQKGLKSQLNEKLSLYFIICFKMIRFAIIIQQKQDTELTNLCCT